MLEINKSKKSVADIDLTKTKIFVRKVSNLPLKDDAIKNDTDGCLFLPSQSAARFALCIKSEDAATLISREIYEVSVASNGYVGVTDEQGEAAVYPFDYFLLLGISPEVERALHNAA